MLEPVTVHGPFAAAAITRSCRNTLAGVVEPDGRSHGAQLSAARRQKSRPMGTLRLEGYPTQPVALC